MEPKKEGTVFLDVTRLPGMYKSEEQVASALGCMISDRFQLDVRIGAGNSRFIAFEAALCASKDARVIPSGMERDFLSPLNIDHLPVPDDVRERLHLLGLHSLGQISAFTLSALTSQFGAAGKELWELSNGVGERGRISCAFAVTDVDRELVCDGPVHSKQQIRAALLELLDGLCLELEELGKACRAIKLVLDLQNRTFFEKQFVLHAPTTRKEDMLRRIMAGLEAAWNSQAPDNERTRRWKPQTMTADRKSSFGPVRASQKRHEGRQRFSEDKVRRPVPRPCRQERQRHPSAR